MRARYYRGEYEGKSWGGPWAEATITVTGEPAETPTPEPVKEEPVQQPPRDAPDPPAGTIDTLTAADETGQLLLTWTAPAANADPTDYHVNWGKSTEDYPANTATEAGNAHPTDTTLTLTVLEFDTDYNIQRAEHATRTARTPPAPGTDRGRRRPPRCTSHCQQPPASSTPQ